MKPYSIKLHGCEALRDEQASFIISNWVNHCLNVIVWTIVLDSALMVIEISHNELLLSYRKNSGVLNS